jgi:transposase
MYVTAIPNHGSRPTILLRESYREDGKVKNRTIANLTHLPPEKVAALREALGGERGRARVGGGGFEITRSRPHGHVVAVLGTLRRLGVERILSAKRCRERDLTVAMIAARILKPSSKLATARGINHATLESTLGEELGVDGATEDDLYGALDWLLGRQERVEKELAARHLRDGALVLYDLTSTYFEGRCCPLARIGHSRDDKHNKLQIEFGLLCDKDGRPCAVEVFEGNTADPKTLTTQIEKLRTRFGIQRVIMVGDRGMITSARIREDFDADRGIHWITALRAPAIKKLVEEGSLQLSLFDERDLAEISSPSFPGERLVVCRNPLLADERGRKRKELLDATERELAKIAAAVRREKRPLRGQGRIGIRLGRVLNRYRVEKHFQVDFTDTSFSFKRNEESIAAEAALDGIYVIRASVASEDMNSEELVSSYKGLSRVERAFRSFKLVDLNVRPIHHRLADRVRAHVFLCMLAYYVEWHMRRALAPVLFDDDDKEGAEAARKSPVAPAKRSLRAERKAETKRTEDGIPVESFRSLLANLATVAKNRIQPTHPGAPAFDLVTVPTSQQERVFELLEVTLRST